LLLPVAAAPALLAAGKPPVGRSKTYDTLIIVKLQEQQPQERTPAVQVRAVETEACSVYSLISFITANT
jgi:hypothetical protein